jgi:uncharacterized protein
LDGPPFRRCLLTRAVLPKGRMVRFVIGPERALVPDLAGRLPGRGIWLSARGDVIETARVRRTLQRAIARVAGGSVAIPADLRELLIAGLERRIAELLARARRAAGADGGSPGGRRGAKLALAIRAEVERLAGLRGAEAVCADEGTGGRVHDGRQ